MIFWLINLDGCIILLRIGLLIGDKIYIFKICLLFGLKCIILLFNYELFNECWDYFNCFIIDYFNMFNDYINIVLLFGLFFVI